MAEYAFLLGKNEQLSLAEIFSYLDSRGVLFKEVELLPNVFVFNTSSTIDAKNIMEDLGGSIKIIKILSSVPSSAVKNVGNNKKKLKEILDGLDLISQLPLRNSKIFFGVSVYGQKYYLMMSVYRLFGSYLKRKLKEQSLNGKFFGYPRDRDPSMTHVEVIKNNLIEESFELDVCIGKEKTYIGTTVAVHNPFEFQKRDVQRPVQRIIFSIPPRLSRIMINLAKTKPGDVLLDPFCGIGSILQEALLMGIDIRGVDTDFNCINGAKRNLNWIKQNYKVEAGNLDKKIFVGDAGKLSRYFPKESIDAIVTEPYLGPPLKSVPSVKKARQIIDEVRPLYQKVLKEMYFVLKKGGCVSIVSPLFRTIENVEVKLEMEKIARNTGFSIVNPIERMVTGLKSFVDAEERHRTLREIFVLKK